MPAEAAPDKMLFTPGPLTTSQTVKQAMLRDLGSRDTEFIESVRRIRQQLLEVAGLSQAAGYEAVLMQGSGTFAIESVISSAIPLDGKLLMIVNGAYGERIVKMAAIHRIPTTVLTYTENELPNLDEVREAAGSDPAIRMIAMVHCETTSGIMNPVDEVGEIAKELDKDYFVDSMSAFGAVPFDLAACNIDYLVSSANKCIEGVPGFGFAICKRDKLVATSGWARTLSLDLLDQWNGLERNGQFRFTPPTHTILAFAQALAELADEGGVPGRARRYRENYECLVAGMRNMGFAEYVPAHLQGYIITSFYYPRDARFEFEEFYRRLNDRGFVIYPGKVTDANCFRIGNIGRIFVDDVRALLAAIAETIAEMGVTP
jgi:2-aminoethylphosphonate-pyruvate transaminase